MISSISHSSLVDLPSLDNNKTKLLSSTRSVRRRNALATDVYCPKLNTNIYKKQGKNGRVWLIAILISLSSFLFGYSMTALNVAITDDDSLVGRLDDDISLTTFLEEFATGLTPTGAFFGCLAGSAPADKYGRRLSVLFTSVSIYSPNFFTLSRTTQTTRTITRYSL